MTDELLPKSGPPPLPPGVIPYATPMAGVAPAAGACWREGTILVVPSTAVLPAVCVKCNAPVPAGEPGSKRLSQKLAWHHPGIFLLIPLGLLVYAIVALCVQKKATVDLSLCPAHNAKRVRWVTFTWIVTLGGLGMALLGCGGGIGYARHDDMWPAWLMLGGLLVAVVGGVIGMLNGRALSPKRIDDRYAWLKGAGPDFLANFEAVPQR